MSNKGKMIALVSVSVALIALILIGTVISVVQKAKERDISSHPGNAEEYDVEKVAPTEAGILTGKRILFLGSSVTLGTASCGVSFADYIAKRNGCEYQKEAVGGTTLVGGKDSYLRRLKKADKNRSFDLFICQLSTNDASQQKPLGLASDTTDDTVLGAINAIVSYVRETWDCPVVFYTNAYFESDVYGEMVKGLKECAEKEEFGVIDLYTDEDFNAIGEGQRKLFMYDRIHPTKAGYLLWWTPKMEEYINAYLTKKTK